MLRRKSEAATAIAVVAALALVAALLAGCGGDSGTDGTVAAGGTPESAPGLVDWPMFGRVPQRTHYLPQVRKSLDPPLREAWSINTHALIEFPPALAGGIAYVINKYGNGKAVRLSDRKVLWEFHDRTDDKGAPTFVTAPVYYEGNVYGDFLSGDVAAGDAKTGEKVWVRDLKGHLEASPLAVDGTLYIGTDTTDLIALDAKTGKTLWNFNAPGAFKASPSFNGGRVFNADYQSSMYALDAKSGKPVWRTNTSKVAPFGEGGFFSSPAIAFGKVFAARDDGTVYAFDEKTGKVAWSFQTGAPVYGSPAVAEVPGTPPTVYIGSEDQDGHFFALDAKTGKVRWKYEVGGPIPGTATVIGHTVYTSSFKTRKTVGIDARTGKKIFELNQAGYTPMVSDGRRLYLVGYFVVVGLEPAAK